MAIASLNMLIMSLGTFLIYSHLQPFGPAAVSGYGVAFRIEQLILLPILGVAFGVMPLISQNHGAGYEDRVRQALTLALTTSILSTTPFTKYAKRLRCAESWPCAAEFPAGGAPAR